MTTFGTLAEYNDGENWTRYIERIDNYFEANEITEDNRKRAILLTVCGGKIYKLMRDLLSPSVIVERFKFNSCVRESKESVADDEARLRNLTTHCKYSAEILTEMLRDRFVCGINNETIQRRLLAETKLTLEKALTLAKFIETAVENTRDISGANKSSASVNFVK